MRAPLKLGLYGAGLAVVFGAAALTAHLVVPEQSVQDWISDPAPTHTGGTDMTSPISATSDAHDAATEAPGFGLTIAQDGFQLAHVTAPTEPGVAGTLSLSVTGPDGSPVTDFVVEHEQKLHLIVARGDGQRFRHAHPTMAADGTWSLPWEWDAAGSYRVYADFIPAATGEPLTLSTMVQVAGPFEPQPATLSSEATVDAYDVAVRGDLLAGTPTELTFTVTRGGAPVTGLEPYLGAFGHLVALRDGDLAYLHVHPHGAAPKPGDTSGPDIVFEVTAPTPGTYLLYLDFQAAGEVHTVPVVVEATGTADAASHAGSSTTHQEGQAREHD
ncbi:heavy-metal-associated domain-containing protein [Leucobacter luti]|uniref:Heavy-metal-associated domain-containing protein n=1 Tax=Leucobacter luti TaxID=340320 RepID=A0A4Q7U656_9MICO|nr:heavy-metal-associated domain-containing protein [Leucobacter luti]MBL3700586.1 heavy-metal-associated domain-containing protein [Leucobacter luti]RZT68577.1 hypothetical protein EV139_0303 [Leucobacter luti]